MARDILTTLDLVNHNAARYSDTPFLNYYDEIITYKDLDEKTDAFANYLLDAGIKKGDVVSFMMGNTPAFFYILLGAQKIGAIGGPVSCWWQPAEVEYLVNDSGPRILVVDPEYIHIVSVIKGSIPSVERILINTPGPMDADFSHDCLPQVVETHQGKLNHSNRPAGSDIAEIMYTSGTTGKPKGVMLTHTGVVFGARVKTEHVPINPAERILCVLPLFHSGGLNDLAYPSMYRGATIILRRNFSAAEFWECVERYRVNGFYIVPTMWNILLKTPEADTVDTRSLRIGLSGAAPIPPEQLEECQRRFNVPILEAYGATENTGGITANMEKKKKYGSVGTPFNGVDVKIFGDAGVPMAAGKIGEIVVKGPTTMHGYFNNPEATAQTIQNGWLYTGDVGYLDDEGFLFIVDRRKDLIIRGGVNVYPQEVENTIANHPVVDAVAVIPAAHEKYGQVAKACIVLKRGEAITENEILEFCRDNMADYKVPENIVFRASLPTNAVGKFLKKDLIRELEEEKIAQAVPVAHFFEGMPNRFIPEKAKGVEASVSYHITGKGGGQWTVSIDNGKMTLSEKILKTPTVYIVAGDAAYNDIVTGKLDGITAVLTGKMTIEGDVNFMTRFREMFEPLQGN